MNALLVLLSSFFQVLHLAHSFHITPVGNHLVPIRTHLHARPQTRSYHVHKNILARRTINNISPILPSHSEYAIRKAIEAAIHAPNHKRTEPWRFYLLGPSAIEKVCRINADLVTQSKGAEAGEKKLKRWMGMPGWLVVTCVKSDDDMNICTSQSREDYAACCCAIQNICLSLHAQGIGTKWTTGVVNFDDRFAEAVGFEHDKEYTVGTIWFGEAMGSKTLNPVKKLGVDDVLKRVD